MSDQHGSNEQTREGQVQRAKRLREQIENLKSGRHTEPTGPGKSLREQIEERAHIEERARSEERAHPASQDKPES